MSCSTTFIITIDPELYISYPLFQFYIILNIHRNSWVFTILTPIFSYWLQKSIDQRQTSRKMLVYLGIIKFEKWITTINSEL